MERFVKTSNLDDVPLWEVRKYKVQRPELRSGENNLGQTLVSSKIFDFSFRATTVGSWKRRDHNQIED
jgi:hypothetical protein